MSELKDRAEQLRWRLEQAEDVGQFWFYQDYDAKNFLDAYTKLEAIREDRDILARALFAKNRSLE